MRWAMMIVAMVAVIAMAGVADAGYVYLVDIGTATSPVATATEFRDDPTGGVPGLTGSEPVDPLDSGSGPGPHTSAGGIVVDFGGAHDAYYPGAGEIPAMGNLRVDWSDRLRGNTTVSIRNVALDPSTECTLYLWGNIDGFSWGPQWYQNGTFTPINNADVTFASTAAVEKFLAVNFTTSAAWDDVNSTIQFTWGPGTPTSSLYQTLNGFAITGPGGAAEPVIPEPAGLGLLGVALLAVRRKRRAQ